MRRETCDSSAIWALLGAAVAAAPALWMWGFTVDDALIAIRYARHLAAGVGWRFNAGGPATDGVTPLAWPLLLAPLARADPLVVLARSKALGLLLWTATGAALGGAIGRTTGAPAWARQGTLATVALSVPLAAHAVSGMETVLATTLATAAALCAAQRRAALLAGLAASLRPELGAWACALALGRAFVGAREARPPVRMEEGAWAREVLVGLGLAAAPFLLCATVRMAVWGRPAPLALMAKPSDLHHGIAYAGAAWVVTLVPLLVLAPAAVARDRHSAVLVLAGLAHVAALAVVGGDWMPYARLMVPVVPSLAYAAVRASAQAHRIASGARVVSACAVGILLIAHNGTPGRRVGSDRAALVARARPLLTGMPRVAALDVGWVGSASEGDVIDLAGLTDPEIAALPGGHTSKHVGALFLLARRPDRIVLYAASGLPDGRLDAWRRADYLRVVEARLAHDEVIARHFEPETWLPLGAGPAGYVVLRSRSDGDGT